MTKTRRRNGLTWLLAAFLMLLVVLWGTTTLLNRTVLGQGGSIARGSVLEVSLSGSIVERPSVFWGEQPVGALGLLEIDRALRRGAEDPRITGVLLRVGPLATGFATAQEIRSAIRAFRQSGKPVVALLEIGTLLDVYVASAAERVVQIPSGNLILGLASRRQYYGDLFEKLGIRFDVFHTGTYKTAMSEYSAMEMSPEERQAIQSLVDGVFSEIVDDMAADRGMSPAQIEAAIDLGLLDAPQAVESGLIDATAFEDDLQAMLGGTGRRVSVRNYLAGIADPWSFAQPAVALIHIDGMLLPGRSGEDPFGGASFAGGDTIAAAIRDARADESVKAIVLRIDSPGGAVTASDVIWREATLAAERLPVIVSMANVAASGGYWIATAGTHVLADPSTYTGSIGVVMSRPDLSEAYAKLGVGNDAVTRGANAGLFLEHRPLDEAQRALLQDSVERTYAQFVDKVAEARGLSAEEVEALAAGRVWTGRQAHALGLVDELGGLRAALSEARRAAALPPGTEPRIRVYPEPRSLFERLGSLLVSARAAPTAAGLDPADMATALEMLRRAFTDRLGSSGLTWAMHQGPLPGPVQ